MGGCAGGQARAGRRAHRVRQDPGGVPVGARPAGVGPAARVAAAPLPRPLRLAAQGARGRRQRNLRSPLAGIRQAAQRLGLPVPDVTVGMRTGDTPADERRQFARTPPDVLVTTPESLFLLLTSAARESLRGVTTVILDEVHAVAGTKRGAHLALSLERLDELFERPAQRIGLSATVRPLDEVSTFLAGRPPGRGRPAAARRRRAGVGRGAGARSRRARRAAGARQLRRGGDRLGGGHRASGRRSGPRSSGGCWSWCAHTGPRSCSPTPGGSPSG